MIIAAVKSYPTTRDSGSFAFGRVPAHWEIKRLKTLCTMQSGEGITGTSIDPAGAYPVYGGNGVRGYTSTYTHDGHHVLIGRQGALCGNVHIARGRFWASEHAVVVTLHSGHSTKWLGAILDVMDLNQYSIAAAQPGLSVERVLNLPIPLPSVREQTGIVRFLDHADRRIRCYIRAKEKLIALLEEQKQAIIHQAVTGQIDVRTGQPYACYKPSSLKWLGDIPRHWEVRRLKTVCRIRYGLGQPPPETPNGLPLIRATNVDKGRIIDRNLLYVDPSTVPIGRGAILQEREIIVVRSGAYTADSAIVPMAYRGAVTGYDMVATVIGAQPEFVAMALLCTYLRNDQLVVASTRSAQPHLNAEELGSSVLLLPPRAEQTAIVDHLDKAAGTIEAEIGRVNRRIELVHEYRTRLIADVVTGKLDVREAAAALPDVDPLEIEDDSGDAVGPNAEVDIGDLNTRAEGVKA